MTKTVIRTAQEHARILAEHLLEQIARAQSSGRSFLLGCPTGRSPAPVYRALADQLRKTPQILAGLVLVMMDEYVVGPDQTLADPEAHYSCQGFARRDIQARLNEHLSPGQQLRDENIWFANPSNPSAFDQRIADAGGIDFFILASGGGDGHVAFNPPGSARETKTRIVALAEQTRIDNMGTFPGFQSLSEVPSHGISVGIDTIARAKACAMLLFGAAKQEAFQRIANASTYEADWPATIVHDIAEAEILADKEAAGKSVLDIKD